MAVAGACECLCSDYFHSIIKAVAGDNLKLKIIFAGSVDEVMQILDDNAMNLQSMSASRFVGPFLANVQNWEKGLSLIGEVCFSGVRNHKSLLMYNFI